MSASRKNSYKERRIFANMEDNKKKTWEILIEKESKIAKRSKNNLDITRI